MDLVDLLVDPTGVQTWRLGESALLSSTAELSLRICELEALRLRMVTDLDTRGTAKTLGASSTAAWLSGATRMSPGAATGMVHVGRALTELADTGEALAAGRISTAHATVVTGFLPTFPTGCPTTPWRRVSLTCWTRRRGTTRPSWRVGRRPCATCSSRSKAVSRTRRTSS